MGPQALDDFLRYFKALKRFEFSFICDFDDGDLDEEYEHTQFTPPRMTEALAHLTDSIEELSLKKNTFQFAKCIETTTLPLYPDAHVAQFFELFPPSLEELAIAHCEINVLDFIGELVTRASLPHLRRIHLSFSTRVIIEQFVSRLEVVKEHGAEKGILLDWCFAGGTGCTICDERIFKKSRRA
ncbi:hypothetical protein IFR05_010376 [Cadophora sp. M221]|nr:hypothetical protein IFR05_010376 [Cadophora sp. M221]